MDYSALGSRIRAERTKKEITQAQLAEWVDVSTAFIGQIERGERKFSIATLVDIASTLRVSVDYLLKDNIENVSSIVEEFVALVERNPKEAPLALDIVRSVLEHMKRK